MSWRQHRKRQLHGAQVALTRQPRLFSAPVISGPALLRSRHAEAINVPLDRVIMVDTVQELFGDYCLPSSTSSRKHGEFLRLLFLQPTARPRRTSSPSVCQRNNTAIHFALPRGILQWPQEQSWSDCG